MQVILYGVTPAQAAAVRWTLVDLLHGVARIWPWLLLEEGYPLPINALNPGRLVDQTVQRWQEMAEVEAEAEEECLYDFRQRHDLSMLMRGIQLAPLWLIKEGRDCVIWSSELSREVSRPHQEVITSLTVLCDSLCEWLSDQDEPRAKLAVARWMSRHQGVEEHYLQIVSGLEQRELAELADECSNDVQQLNEFFELSERDTSSYSEPNELLMAARMTSGVISLSAQRCLLKEIKDITRIDTAPLDAVVAKVPTLNEQDALFEQGYVLAAGLREYLGIDEIQLLEPETILRVWGIPVQDVTLQAGIDAVAVWGQQRGPCILLNKHSLSRAATENGLRTTLAHEICLLLVDRHRAFPVVEVLGGQVSKYAEQRANAFAAELLLPRAQAASACEAKSKLLDAANHLEQHFKVSRELVSHQINNSNYGYRLESIDHRQLTNWRLEYSSKPNQSAKQ